MPTMTTPKPMPQPRNGIDTPALLTTINAVGAQPELAKFQFRAENRWQTGTHSRTRIQSFSGAGGEQIHVKEFTCDADHPKVLTGQDQAPTPVEFLLHALAGCLTAGIGNVAAARGVTLTDQVRNGYQQIRVSFTIKGDAPPAVLEKIVEQSRKRSAVYDVLTNGVPVTVSVTAG